MVSAKPFVVQSDRSEEQVFATALSVVQDGEYDIQGICNETREMLVTGGGPTAGHLFMMTAKQAEAGSVLQVTAANTPGTSWSWKSGKKNQAAGETFCADVQARLDSGVVATPQPVESFARGSDGTVVPWTGGDLPID